MLKPVIARTLPIASAATLVLLFATLMMRGPVTCVGPLAELVRDAFGASYADYGLLAALPIAAFGLFSFPGPALAARLGLRGAVLASIAVVTLGAWGRLSGSWTGFLAATIGVGAGIALLNVYMPVAVKKTYAAKDVALMMGIYTGVIGLSGSIGGLTASPLAAWTGSLVGPMAFWGLLGILAASAWAMGAPALPASAGTAKGSIRTIVGKPVAWALTAVMGLQSLLIYTVCAWMPPYWMSEGMSRSETGFWIFVFLVSGLPASILTDRFMRAMKTDARASAALALIYLAGLGLWLWGGAGLLPGSVLAGASQGAMLSVAFILMAKKSSDAPQMLAMSSMAQGFGYLGAGLGPIVFGWLCEWTGGWSISFVFTAAVMVLWGLSGIVASQRDSIDG